MNSKKLAQLCSEFADNKKAENIAVLDVRKVSSVTDYFVVASGTSEPHLRAIVSEITDQLREKHELRPTRMDGHTGGAWVVLDFFDVIVHVMRADVRERYDLESLWGDAGKVKPPKPRKFGKHPKR
ncbi:MAG: ribosome silencing factor [Verrucomicrobiota bacterium]|jgi:ribosome-associated protein